MGIFNWGKGRGREDRERQQERQYQEPRGQGLPGQEARPPAFDLAAELDEDQLLRLAGLLRPVVAMEGWGVVEALLRRAHEDTVQLIHDPNVPSPYIAGSMKALEAIPVGVRRILGCADAVLKARADAAAESARPKRLLSFLRPGTGNPITDESGPR